MSQAATIDGAEAAPGRRPVPGPRPWRIPPTRVWWHAYRHHLRLLRNQAIAWIVLVAGVGAALATVFQDMFPTAADRQRAAASLEGVPAFEALFGRTVELATVEGFVLWRWGGFAVLVVAVWGMAASSRLLRGAEEAGRLEPLRAGVLTARGLLGAALAAEATVFAVLAVAVGVSHTVAGMDAATAWVLGAVLALLAATFASAGAVVAQIVPSRRRVNALVGALLGVTLAMRVLAAGTGTPDWLWGATPFGWASYLHEVDGARVRVLVAYLVLVSLLTVAAFGLARRDLHGGLVRGAERRQRTRAIGGHRALAVRLAAGPVMAWGSGLAAAGLIFGLLAEDFAAAMADLPATVEAAERVGYVAFDTPEGAIGGLLLFLTLALGLFAAAQAGAIREEEASWRLEHLLARRVGRVAWLAVRTGVAAGAVVVLAAVTALAAWAGTSATGSGLAAGDLGQIAANLVPVAWLFLGAGVALVGVVPRVAAPITYALVLVTYLLDLVGGFLDLPDRVLRLSPFRHIASVPAADLAVGPAVAMVAAGIAAAVVGAVALARRDLAEA